MQWLTLASLGTSLGKTRLTKLICLPYVIVWCHFHTLSRKIPSEASKAIFLTSISSPNVSRNKSSQHLLNNGCENKHPNIYVSLSTQFKQLNIYIILFQLCLYNTSMNVHKWFPNSSWWCPYFLEWEPIHSPADLPNPGIKPGYPALQAYSLPAELLVKPSYLKKQQLLPCSSLPPS